MSIKDKFIMKGAGTVRSFKIKDGSGVEHEMHFYAKTPNEVAQYFGAQNRFDASIEGDAAKQDHRAEFIASNMVEPDGKTPLFTLAEAKLIPITLRAVMVANIIEGSNSIEGVKKS